MPDRLNSKQRQLVEDRVGLARAIGHRHWKRLSGYDRDDIISYAFQGLVMAAQRWEVYCEENGFEAYEGEAGSWFDTYASRRINGAIIDALRSADPATRRERALIKQILAAGVNLSSPWEHEPAESIARRAGMDVADVKKAIAALVRMPVSMEETSEDAWPADPVCVVDDALEAGLCSRVVVAIRAMPELHQQVVAMAFYANMDDAEIARRIPEIREQTDHALRWVAFVREQVSAKITAILRKELEPERPELSIAG